MQKNNKIAISGLVGLLILIVIVIIGLSNRDSSTNPPVIDDNQSQKIFEEMLNKEVVLISEEEAKEKAMAYLSEYQKSLDEHLASMNESYKDIYTEEAKDDLLPKTIIYDVVPSNTNVAIDKKYCGTLDNEEKCIYDPEDNYTYFTVMDIYTYKDYESQMFSKNYLHVDIAVNMVTGEVHERDRTKVDFASLNFDGTYQLNDSNNKISIKTTEEGLAFEFNGRHDEIEKTLSGLAELGTRDNFYEFKMEGVITLFEFDGDKLYITTDNSNSIIEPILGTYTKK